MLFLLACLTPTTPGALVPPTVDEDASLPALELGDTLLRHETFGDPADPLIVVMPGGPGADYDGLLRLSALADEGWFVVFYDQRSSGLSRRHPDGSTSVQVHVDDLSAVIDHHGQDPAALIGHSWGGQLATAWVAQHPDRCGVVVLAEPGPLNDAQYHALNVDGVALMAPHISSMLWAEALVLPDDHAQRDLHFQQLFTGQFEGYHMSETDPMPFQRYGAVAWSDIVADITSPEGEVVFDLTEGLADWEGHALFLQGGLSETHSDAILEDMMGSFPSAELVEIPGAGHDLLWVEADAVLDEIRRVLPGQEG